MYTEEKKKRRNSLEFRVADENVLERIIITIMRIYCAEPSAKSQHIYLI